MTRRYCCFFGCLVALTIVVLGRAVPGSSGVRAAQARTGHNYDLPGSLIVVHDSLGVGFKFGTTHEVNLNVREGMIVGCKWELSYKAGLDSVRVKRTPGTLISNLADGTVCEVMFTPWTWLDQIGRDLKKATGPVEWIVTITVFETDLPVLRHWFPSADADYHYQELWQGSVSGMHQ